MTTTWATPAQRDELHPDLVAALDEVVAEAVQVHLRPVFRSGHRSNAKQTVLYKDSLAKTAAWEANGQVGPRPLPAAPPGASAHNWTENGLPAAAAVDIALLDEDGHFIPSGGGLPYAKRDARWQLWANLVQAHPQLRDGGSFSKPDPVHVELRRWNFKTRTVRPS